MLTSGKIESMRKNQTSSATILHLAVEERRQRWDTRTLKGFLHSAKLVNYQNYAEEK